MRLIDAPIGLFMSKEGVMCLKTEYIADWGVEAYIVSSGEIFWGGAKTAEERNNLEVTPVDAVPVVRCKDCKYLAKARSGFYCSATTNPNWVSEDHYCSYGERKDGNG